MSIVIGLVRFEAITVSVKPLGSVARRQRSSNRSNDSDCMGHCRRVWRTLCILRPAKNKRRGMKLHLSIKGVESNVCHRKLRLIGLPANYLLTLGINCRKGLARREPADETSAVRQVDVDCVGGSEVEFFNFDFGWVVLDVAHQH